MGLLSRWRRSTPGPAAQAEAISAFWSWWRIEGAAATAAAISTGRSGDMVDEIGRRVSAIHPELGWELNAGHGSDHVLVVTSEGNAELRATARRWRRAAPTADDMWSFSDVRLPSVEADGLVLGLDDVELAVRDVLVSARVRGSELDVGVFHPAFTDLAEEQRLRAAVLLLDQVVGEAAVETWLGVIEALTLAPLDPIPLATLPVVVRQVEELNTEGGQPTWALLEGADARGHPVLASAQVPLKPATAPHLDTYVGVTVPYSDRTENGLPGDGSLGPLRSFEKHLVQRLGDSGRLVAHQSHDGVRVLHLYVDSATPAAEQVRAAVGGWDQGGVTVEVVPDPAWQAVAHLRA
jgi:hypothetical protein